MRPEESDERLAERVGRSDRGVHQRKADSAALMRGEHADWAEAECRYVTDEPASGHHMADDGVVELGHDRQRWEPSVALAQGVQEANLDGFIVRILCAERGDLHATCRSHICRSFSPNDHTDRLSESPLRPPTNIGQTCRGRTTGPGDNIHHERETGAVSYQHLLVDSDGPITTITLNRPEKRNALALDVMIELTQAFRDIAGTKATGVILAANGPVFSAGHNFGDMAGAALADIRHLFAVCTELMDTVQSVPQVVIARVHALATAAGCQLVATCDLAIAAETAGFAIPGGKGGLCCHTPLVAVARNVGRKRALEMALTGDPITAATAAEWGLINHAVPDAQLVAATHDLLARATRGSVLSKATGKRGFYAQVGLDQPAAYALAAELMATSATTADAQEGIAAFLEKRKPDFTQRA